MNLFDFFRKRTNKVERPEPAAPGMTGSTRADASGPREIIWSDGVREVIDPTRTDIVGTATGDFRLSIEVGNIAEVRKLLDSGIDPNAKLAGGWTPLHWAAATGRSNIITLLLKHGAAIDVHQNEGLAPIHLAAKDGHDEAVRMLVSNGADVDSRSGSSGSPPLHYAIIQERPRTVATLLQCHADVNAADWDGIAGLHLAAGCALLDIVKMLVDNGADVNAGRGTQLGTALSLTKDVATAEFLRSRGAV